MDAEQTKDSQAGLQITMSMRNNLAADSAGTDHVTSVEGAFCERGGGQWG